MSQTEFIILYVNTPDGFKKYVSLLPMEDKFARGIVSEAIVGEIIEEVPEGVPIPPNAFARNPRFVELLHRVVAREAPKQKSLQAEAKNLKDGWVYVIDCRAQNAHGDVLNEDIIGAFEVKDGKVVDGSYTANKYHRILSTRGFFRLSPEIYGRLWAEIRLLNGEK